MCGLVGTAGKLAHKDEALMKRLLVFDYFRGPDSTGLASIRNTGEVKIAKGSVNPLDLFDMKRFQDTNNGYGSAALIGHNRLATKGSINNVNAHPFQYDHIIGAHNGTLDASSWTALDDALGEKHAVDSMALIHAIAVLGIEETVPLLQGAWALTWYNLKDKTMNFLRNKERPLWIAYSKGFDQIFWSSEWAIMDSALNTAPSSQSYDMHQEAETGYQYWSFAVDHWYKFDIEKLKEGGTEIPKAETIELKGKEPAPVFQGGVTNFQRRENSMWTKPNYSGNGSTHSHHSTGNDKQKRDCVTIKSDHDKPFGGFLTKDQFDAFAKYGCSYCSSSIEFEDVGVTVFESQGLVLCPSCATDDVNRLYVVDLDRIAS